MGVAGAKNYVGMRTVKRSHVYCFLIFVRLFAIKITGNGLDPFDIQYRA